MDHVPNIYPLVGKKIPIMVWSSAAFDIAKGMNEYYQAGLITGGIAGLAQAGTYATMAGVDSMAIGAMTSEVYVAILIVVGMVVTNIAYLYKKFAGGSV
jgi:hypothetical protein